VTVRICCDPCTDPAAVTLRDGTKVLHFTNLPRAGTWGPFEFGFYEPVDPDDEESEPNLDAPIDLTGSTWALHIYSEDSDGLLLPFGSFDVWDLDDASDGLVRGSLTDTELTSTAAVGADCAPTYVFELIQTSGDAIAYPYIGTIQVTDASTLLSLLGA
jgi:hypothetical protein